MTFIIFQVIAFQETSQLKFCIHFLFFHIQATSISSYNLLDFVIQTIQMICKYIFVYITHFFHASNYDLITLLTSAHLARVKESTSEEYGYIGKYSIGNCIFSVVSVIKIDNSMETTVKLWLSKQDAAVNGQQIENFSYNIL